jgi:hypothetical protein
MTARIIDDGYEEILDALPNGSILTDEAIYHEFSTVVAYVKQPEGHWASSDGDPEPSLLPPLRLIFQPKDVVL